VVKTRRKFCEDPKLIEQKARESTMFKEKPSSVEQPVEHRNLNGKADIRKVQQQPRNDFVSPAQAGIVPLRSALRTGKKGIIKKPANPTGVTFKTPGGLAADKGVGFKAPAPQIETITGTKWINPNQKLGVGALGSLAAYDDDDISDED